MAGTWLLQGTSFVPWAPAQVIRALLAPVWPWGLGDPSLPFCGVAAPGCDPLCGTSSCWQMSVDGGNHSTVSLLSKRPSGAPAALLEHGRAPGTSLSHRPALSTF